MSRHDLEPHQLVYKERLYSFDSEISQWCFEQDPERYAGHRSFVDRFIGGEILPPRSRRCARVHGADSRRNGRRCLRLRLGEGLRNCRSRLRERESSHGTISDHWPICRRLHSAPRRRGYG
ncbi:MAG: YHS domain-containing protein [Actinomycetota bacterium]|nr:YHS domain-containing protein [Actinomycetota bacterium]